MIRTLIIFFAALTLGACAMPQPRPISHDVVNNRPLDSVAKELFKMAELCWYSQDGVAIVGRQVKGIKLSPEHSQITVNFRSTSSRTPTPFFTVDITKSGNDTIVISKKSKCLSGCDVPLENDLKRWISGDLSCSNLGG
ncbi:MAG: hypothetical protein PVI97_18890 [Candidatus Thiodiazotropha sp.]|jgi:hypothetical protein